MSSGIPFVRNSLAMVVIAFLVPVFVTKAGARGPALAAAFIPSIPARHFHAENFRMPAPASVPVHGSVGDMMSETAPSYASLKREQEKRDWIDRSIVYYSKVMREERRRSIGQIQDNEDPREYMLLAKKHYFALRKIKDGKPSHAETIYRRIINELVTEDDDCDHAKLAVTTLLLALHLQRERYPARKTRRVFLSFFRLVLDADDECACSAKVLQAFALFEMKQGNTLKSLHIVNRAVELDPQLKPVLKWKQFRDAKSHLENQRKGILRP